MPTEQTDLPALMLLNPIALALIGKGWEDPSWGHAELHEASIATTIYALAGGLRDEEIKNSIRRASAIALAAAAERLKP